MKKYQFLLVAFGFVIVSGVTARVHATAPKGPDYDGIRSMGMGNTTVAVVTDRTAIFHNPAGLALLKDRFQLSVAPLTFSVDGTFFRYTKILARNADKLSNIQKLMDKQFIADIDSIDGVWAGIEYLPEITMAMRNIGFGFYSVWPLNVRIETGHFIPKLGIQGQRDIVCTWAVGIPLSNENNLFGLSMKYVQRTDLPERITTYSETFKYFDRISSGLGGFGVIGDLGDPQHGASFDFGFMHNFSGFRLAYALKNAGVLGGKLMAPQLNIGGAYYFPSLDKVAWIRSMVAALEISDVWGFEESSGRYENFLKKLHAGAEIDIKYVAVRAGLSQGYPTAGIGLALGPMSLDYVYFTKEMGYYPGQEPRSMHVLSVGYALYIEDKK